MKTVCFDIETGPAPDAALFTPEFTAPAHYKEPAAIQKAIKAKKESWEESLALSPLTGQVLCIVYSVDDKERVFDGGGDEKTLLRDWKLACTDLMIRDYTFYGWNIASFDIPFLCKRAWKHGVLPMVGTGFDYYRQDTFIDLKAIWDGRRPGEHTSLKNAARFLGVGDKSNDGEHFAQLWATNRKAAEAYALNDIRLCRSIAQRMGLIPNTEPTE